MPDHTGLDYLPLADRLLEAVIAAGRLEANYFRSGLTVTRKTDSSPVTIADQEAEAILLAALAKAAPGIPVVAEEAAAAGDIPQVGDRFFLVDPLDGTRSFISGNPDFSVNVALIEYGKPTLGIIYAPATGKFYASLGPSVAVQAVIPTDSNAGRLSEVNWRQIRTRKPDPGALSAVASRDHGRGVTDALLARWNIKERKNIGSSLKFCLVACAEADVYPRFGSINEWDTAAGQAIVQSAGGCVTLFDGSDLTYGKAGFRNPDFIAWGCRELATQLTPVGGDKATL